MRRLLTVIIVVALIVVAANLITVEVKPIDPHEGAVAYAHPELTATFRGGSTKTPNAPGTAPSAATPSLVVNSHPYIAPQPVRKSLWASLLPQGCLTVSCSDLDLGSPFSDDAGGGCTVKSTSTVSVSVKTYAKLTILGAGGAAYEYRTENVSQALSQKVDQLTCSLITANNIQWTFSGTATYDIGTFYFTNGWGSYAFTAEIWMIIPGEPDVKLGTTSLAVSPTA